MLKFRGLVTRKIGEHKQIVFTFLGEGYLVTLSRILPLKLSLNLIFNLRPFLNFFAQQKVASLNLSIDTFMYFFVSSQMDPNHKKLKTLLINTVLQFCR